MLSISQKKLLEQYTSHYEEKLYTNVNALTYLAKRGLTRETISLFRLGLVEEPHPESGHDFLTGRLVIPYITQTGIVQLRFRALPFTGIPGDSEPSPKIMGEGGVKTTIYNAISLLNPEGTLCVCEGEFDTMSASQAGFTAIGIPGANAWDKVYGLILRYRKVVILADNDDHGEGLKFAKTVRESVRGSRIKLMPEGEDVNSLLVKLGTDGLREYING